MPGFQDFLNTTAVGGKTTPVPVIEPGEDAGSVGDKTSITGGVTYGDLLKLFMSSQQSQQSQPFTAALPQAVPAAQGQDVPIFNVAANLPQGKPKQQDNSSQILSILAKFYGVGG